MCSFVSFLDFFSAIHAAQQLIQNKAKNTHLSLFRFRAKGEGKKEKRRTVEKEKRCVRFVWQNRPLLHKSEMKSSTKHACARNQRIRTRKARMHTCKNTRKARQHARMSARERNNDNSVLPVLQFHFIDGNSGIIWFRTGLGPNELATKFPSLIFLVSPAGAYCLKKSMIISSSLTRWLITAGRR